MQEAADLMVVLRRLLKREDDAHEGYVEDGIAFMDRDWLDYGAGMFRAGQSRCERAKVLRAELSALEAKYQARS